MLPGSVARHAAHRLPPQGRPVPLQRAPIPSAPWPRQAPGAAIGHRRSAAQRSLRSEPQHTMHLVMSGLAVLILAAICGLSGFFVIAELQRGHRAQAIAKAPAAVPDLSSRLLDPKPLSLEEVFAEPEIRPVAGAAAYTVDMTHIDTDCAIAATGRTGELLDEQSCSQVVRASITAPYGGYHVTAGVFNLADAAGAAEVGRQLGALVESGQGSFAAMADGGPDSDPRTQPLSQVSWHEHGHYLVYCVISRPDGQVVRNDDPYAPRITADLVESYLGGRILAARSSGA